MMHLNELYDQRSWMAMEAKVADMRSQVRKADLYFLVVWACLFGVALIFYVEYHMVTSLFGDLVEESETAFTPAIMALTAPVMILGFHALASYQPENLAVRFIRSCPKFFIPVYLIGIGLIIAGLIYERGILSLLNEGVELNVASLLEETPPSWTEWFIQTINNPVAALLFSLGIGGLAVVNIFVADFLLHKIKDVLRSRRQIILGASEVLSAHKELIKLVGRYDEIDFKLADLSRLDNGVLAEQQGLKALDVIHDELIHPKRNLLNAEHEQEPLEFFKASSKPTDLKPIRLAIEKIEAVNLALIIQWMELPKNTSNLSRKRK